MSRQIDRKIDRQKYKKIEERETERQNRVKKLNS